MEKEKGCFFQISRRVRTGWRKLKRTGADKGEDELLRETREGVLVGAVQNLLADPVPPALRGRFEDEMAEHARAHVVRGGSGWRLAADGPEEEPGAACVGVVPGRVRLAAEDVVREGLERWRCVVVPVWPAAGHGCVRFLLEGGGSQGNDGGPSLGSVVCVRVRGRRARKGVLGGRPSARGR